MQGVTISTPAIRGIVLTAIVFLVLAAGGGVTGGIAQESNETYDFGDAPDPRLPSDLSSNGAHHADTSRAYLGTGVDEEFDSQQVDNDSFDDGLVNHDPITVDVTNEDYNGTLYLNVLVDWDGNDRWEPYNRTKGKDAIITRHYRSDWVVQNKPVDIAPGTTSTVETNATAKGAGIGAGTATWVRLTLTAEPINGSYTGRGSFDIGETEDHFVQEEGTWIFVNCEPTNGYHTDLFVTHDVQIFGPDYNPPPTKLSVNGFLSVWKNAGGAGGPGDPPEARVKHWGFWEPHDRWHPFITIHNLEVEVEGSIGTTSASTCQAFIRHFPLIFFGDRPVFDLNHNPRLLHHHVVRTSRATQVVSQDLTQIENRVQRLQNQDSVSPSEVAAVRSQHAAISGQLSDLQSQVGEMEQTDQNITDMHQTNVIDVKSAVEDRKAKASDLKQKIEAGNLTDDDIQDLKDRKADYKDWLNAKINRLDQQITELEDEKQTLEQNQENDEYSEQISRIETRIQDLKSRKSNCEDRLQRMNSDDPDVRHNQTLAELQHEVDRRGNQIQQLENIDQNLSTTLSDFDSNKQTIEDDISSLETRHTQVGDQIDSLDDQPPVGSASDPPTNVPENDGGDGNSTTREDVNGNGQFDIVDVQSAFQNRESSAIQDNPGRFDYNGNGEFDIVDVQRLFQLILNS